jgi:hypothetical protein
MLTEALKSLSIQQMVNTIGLHKAQIWRRDALGAYIMTISL